MTQAATPGSGRGGSSALGREEGRRPRLAILASGTGSNAIAIAEAAARGEIDAELVLVAGDRPGAPVMERMRRRGVATRAIDAAAIGNRERYEQVLVGELRARGVDYIALAGYMRICGPALLGAFAGRTLNVHPSLLPAFPGLDAPGQALRAGVRETGVTVHFIDEGVDTGPIVAQRTVPIVPGDSRDWLQARIQRVEHELYPLAIADLVAGRLDHIASAASHQTPALEHA